MSTGLSANPLGPEWEPIGPAPARSVQQPSNPLGPEWEVVAPSNELAAARLQQQAKELSLTEGVGRGLKRGTAGIQGGIAGAMRGTKEAAENLDRWAADLMGLDYERDVMAGNLQLERRRDDIETAKRIGQEAQEKSRNLPSSPSAEGFQPQNWRWWTEGISDFVPQLALQAGLAAGTGGGSAVAQVLVFAGTGGTLEAGNAYQEARERGASVNTATTEALLIGSISSALETIPGSVILRKNPAAKSVFDASLKKAITNQAKHIVGGYVSEGGTEAAQEAWADTVQWMMENDPKAFNEGLTRYGRSFVLGGAAGGGLAAVGAAGDVASEVSGKRAKLQEKLDERAARTQSRAAQTQALEGIATPEGAQAWAEANPDEAGRVAAGDTLSRSEWESLGFPGRSSAATRKAFVDAVKASQPAPVQKEIPDAQQEQIPTPTDAGGGARVETEVPQGPEPGSGKGIREGGQAGREVPAVEVAPSQPEVQVGEAATEPPADLARRAARGESIERPEGISDSRWRAMIAQQAKRMGLKAPAPVEPTELPSAATQPPADTVEPPVAEKSKGPKATTLSDYTRQPFDNFPDGTRDWLQNAISRRPAGLDSPKAIADWIAERSSQGRWRAYASQQGHESLEQTVAQVMSEMAAPVTEKSKGEKPKPAPAAEAVKPEIPPEPTPAVEPPQRVKRKGLKPPRTPQEATEPQQAPEAVPAPETRQAAAGEATQPVKAVVEAIPPPTKGVAAASEAEATSRTEIDAAVAKELASRKKPKRSEVAKERKEVAKKKLQQALRKLVDPTELSMGLNPRKVIQAVDAVEAALEYGIAAFDQYVSLAVETLGEKAVRDLAPYLESAWQHAGPTTAGKVEDVLSQPSKPPATEVEAKSGDLSLTSIKNEIVNELRAQRGVAELPEVPAQTREEWMDAAAARIVDTNGTIGPALVAEIKSKPRNLSNIEVAILQTHYRAVNNSFEAASDELFRAVESNDPVAASVAQHHVDNLMAELASIEDATKAAGREWGRAGVARQIVLSRDFSLAAMVRKARVANAGKPLTPEQAAEITKLAKQVEKLEQDLATSESARADLERARRVQEGIDKDLAEKKKRAVYKKSERRQKAEAKVASAWAEFESLARGKLYSNPVELGIPAVKVIKAYVELGVVSFGEFMARAVQQMGTANAQKARTTFAEAWDELKAQGEIPGIDLEQTDVAGVTRFARQIQKALVEAGITQREDVVDAVHESLQEFWPDITRRETMDALSGYGQFSPLSKDEILRVIRDINGQLQQLAKLEDMEAGQAPAKTGPERRTPSDEERRLIKQVNEAKKRGGFIVTDPEQQLKTALDAAKTATTNRIADMEHEIRTKERIVRNRTELKPDAELESLRKQRDALRDVHKELFPPKGATQEQKIAAASRALDKAIEQIEAQLKTGDVEPKARPVPLSTPDLDAKRARLEALREQRDALRDSGRLYKANLKKRIADYEQRIANGEFEPRPKKEPRTLTREELDLKRQLEDVKQDFFKKVADYRLENMSPWQKAWDYVRETAHLSRAAMTSIDLSAVFRQGGPVVFAHPRMSRKAGKKMLQAVWSRQAEFDSVEEIRNRPNAQLYETARLSITEEEGRITRQEEAFMGRWGKKIAPIRASSRAYTTFLNNLRADSFDAMVENLGRSGSVTLDEAKVIATYINVATGRADLGKYNTAMANLNTVFFAPRYVASRFQYLAMPFYLPFSKTSPRVKRAIAAEYARHAAGVGLFMALAVGLGALLSDDDDDIPTIEFDPRSSDFGKIKIGETRIDPLSGLAQTTVFLARLTKGETKTSSGEILPLRGDDVKFGQSTTTDVMKRFAWSKLAPIPGSAVDLLEGENVVGEKRTPAGVVTEMFIPLSFRDVYDTMKTRGIPAGTAVSLLNILGMGTATYGPRTEYLTGSESERQVQLAKFLESMEWNSDLPPYSEALTQDQLEQVDVRRQERRQVAVFNGAATEPDQKTHASDETYQQSLKSWNASKERLGEMAKVVPVEDALRLLRDYYVDKLGGIQDKSKKDFELKPGYVARRRALTRMYNSD